ncbi:putative Gnk2-like domain-containing protein [Lupinus albus]|uniref:Putative Gnk2-like domain-containing protein n=1 Tax=Lupinus albus TaxID=3870 RepID=A0A6A4QQ75_LUPAL|nr:putative Gnk2-like domain-containing protein [Lupinus albus]
MQSLIRKATVETNMLYAMGSFNLSANNEERYGLVQCSRDINSEQCGECLEAMLDKVPQCCETKLGWQVLAPSCLMKYDDNMFYLINDKTTSPSSLPNPGTFTSHLFTIVWFSSLHFIPLFQGEGSTYSKKILTLHLSHPILKNSMA